MARHRLRALLASAVVGAATLIGTAPASPAATPGPSASAGPSATSSAGTATPSVTPSATPSATPSVTSSIAPSATPSAAASTPATAAALRVSVASVTPRVATPATDVVLTVTVTNAGASPLTGVAAAVTLGDRRFTKRGEIGTWLATPTESSGGPMARVTASSPEPLPPRGTRTLTVVVPRSAWALPRPFAAVPVDVVVTAAGSRQARARTVVPFVAATQQYVPLRIAWAAPLTLPADEHLFTGSADTVLQAWTRAIGPGSALRERLAAAGSTPVTWFADPSLVTAPVHLGVPAAAAAPSSASAAPGPTPTASSSAAPAPAPTDAAAARRAAAAAALTSGLVDVLGSLPPTQDLWSLPMADADSAALAGLPLSGELRERLYPTGPTPLDAALGRTLPRGTAWPADGRWSQDRVASWPATGGFAPGSVLVSTAGLQSAVGYTPSAVHRGATGGPGLLAYDEDLSRIAGGTAPGSSPRDASAVVQRFLGESLVLLGEREGTPREVVVAIPRSARADASTLRELWAAAGATPWLRTTSLPSLVAGIPTSAAATTRAPTTRLAPPTPLGARSVADADDAARTAEGLAQILPADRARLGAEWSATQVERLSARWRGDGGAWERLGRDARSVLGRTADGVQVSPATVNFLTDAGAVAITVTNDLPYPVSGVRLRLTPGNGKLRVDHQPGPLTIQARSRATVRVGVTALGAGDVPLLASLSTPSGTPLGTPRTVTMNVRPPGQWILYVAGGGLALLLLAALARTLHRRPQTRAAREDLDAPAPHPETVEGPAPASAAGSGDQAEHPEDTRGER